MAETTPCDHLTEPFHRTGYCVNCGVLAQLHTPDGWRRYYEERARACAYVAGDHERRAADLRRSEARALATSKQAPDFTAQCRAGFWPDNGGTTGDSTTCARCGRDKSHRVHTTEEATDGD